MTILFNIIEAQRLEEFEERMITFSNQATQTFR